MRTGESLKLKSKNEDKAAGALDRSDILGFCGIGFCAGGISMFSLGAGFIALGVLFMAVAIFAGPESGKTKG